MPDAEAKMLVALLLEPNGTVNVAKVPEPLLMVIDVLADTFPLAVM
jgi:hypothetical protein